MTTRDDFELLLDISPPETVRVIGFLFGAFMSDVLLFMMLNGTTPSLSTSGFSFFS